METVTNVTMEAMQFTETMTDLVIFMVIATIIVVMLGSIIRAFTRIRFTDKGEDDEDDDGEDDDDNYKHEPKEEVFRKKVKPIDPKEFE